MNFRKSENSGLLIGVFIWLALTVGFFAPAVFGGKVLAPMDCVDCIFRPFATNPIEQTHNQYNSDGASQYLPYNWAMQQSWKHDGYMGWNPYTHNGTSLPENTMLSPGDWHHWLFALLPFWTAWDLGIIMQFFIAGLGMIILVKRSSLPISCALLAAVGFSFFSQFIMWMYDRWFGGMIWAPWIVWAFMRRKEKRDWLNIPAVLFISLAFRGGNLQTCTFVVLLVACLFLAEWWEAKNRCSWKAIIFSASPYLVSGLLAALLSLDVFVDTLPRMQGCKTLPFDWGISRLPSLITFIIPNFFGTPQSLSLLKIIDSDLFDIKYSGCVLFILAAIGLLNPRAPLAAKLIFIISLVASFSPLATFLYSRSTVVMALGMSWLASWQLFDLSRNPKTLLWRKLAWGGGIILLLWLLSSILLSYNQEILLEKMRLMIDRTYALSQAQNERSSWYYLRAARLIKQLMIWDWRNLLLILFISMGLYACSRINSSCKRPIIWVGCVILCTFGELAVFSFSWVTYGEKAKNGSLYPEPSWMSEFRANVGDGAVKAVNSVNDKDFMINNHLSSYGIRLASGYETVQPKYLKPLGSDYDPEDFASAGISHLMCNAKCEDPSVGRGWKVVQKTEDFFLLANPMYQGRYFIRIDGQNALRPISPTWRTPNRMHFIVPPEARTLIVLESFSKGWEAKLDDETSLPIAPTERYGIEICLPNLPRDGEVLLQYHTPYRNLYYPIMGCTALSLCIVSLYRRKRGRVIK